MLNIILVFMKHCSNTYLDICNYYDVFFKHKLRSLHFYFQAEIFSIPYIFAYMKTFTKTRKISMLNSFKYLFWWINPNSQYVMDKLTIFNKEDIADCSKLRVNRQAKVHFDNHLINHITKDFTMKFHKCRKAPENVSQENDYYICYGL